MWNQTINLGLDCSVGPLDNSNSQLSELNSDLGRTWVSFVCSVYTGLDISDGCIK